jgi:hypothetical protein
VPEVSAIDARNYSPERLEAFPLAPWASRRRHDLLELLDRLSPTIAETIAELTQTIEQKAEKCAAARRLRTHPGVGSLTALAFVLIIGTAERVQCGKQIASYLGWCRRGSRAETGDGWETSASKATRCCVFCWTNGWQTWQTLIVPRIPLPAGTHTLQMVMDTGGITTQSGTLTGSRWSKKSSERGVFPPVLANNSESFALIACISVGESRPDAAPSGRAAQMQSAGFSIGNAPAASRHGPL